jgi:hypothetical protein
MDGKTVPGVTFLCCNVVNMHPPSVAKWLSFFATSPKKFVSSFTNPQKQAASIVMQNTVQAAFLVESCAIFPYIYIFIRYKSLYSSHFFPFSHEVY